MKKVPLLLAIFLLLFAVVFIKNYSNNKKESINPVAQIENGQQDPLTISAMRAGVYPGSNLKIEETLEDGENYHQYIASYLSDGLKIYGLLTIPIGNKPAGGWPVIIFNHGYIPPTQYRTTERYTAYVDAFARDSYIIFKPDYRGNGSSEGAPEGSYYSPAYTVDVLNALASVKKLPDVNPNKIGMWGHSLGGNITLRSLVISPDIKAAVIWGGVVGTYDDLMNNWQRRATYSTPPNELALRNRSRADLIQKYGTLQQNPKFWQSIDPNYNLQFVSAPVQLHAGLSDEEVPWQFSEGLKARLGQAGKYSEFYTYSGADHNISEPSFSLAMQRSVNFFNKYLK
ncbi:alpha/beta fold hydrolase [Candidatus Daviesbacteria bacterium]|nr:alpha/beta fold hydrolase [Candidatus Daviesbacteria bacterium]